jgi:transaldolase/glucose-6-phosphate isomerase
VSISSTKELVERLKAKDPTIWGPPGTPELADRLGWVDLAGSMAARVPDLESIAADAIADRTDHVVLLGMGGSSLAPEVFGSVLGVADGYPGLTVLDSTHPDQVRAVAESINPGRTIFIVSSKSGGTLETISGFRFFWEATGGNGRRFIAITDPGSSLERLGSDRGFRQVVTAPSEVGGRFSALTPFGLLPAAMIGADLMALLEAAAGVSWETSVDLGISWGEWAREGRDKLTFLTSPGLAALPGWLEQLVAESLGKDDKGVVPVAREPNLDRYGDDRGFLVYALEGELVGLPPPGHRGLERSVAGKNHLAAEMMAAEIATAVAGMVLGVHPFNQPDVELAKQRARQVLEGETGRADLVDIFSPVLSDLLDEWMASIRPGDYVAIHAYLPMDHATETALTELRYKIGNRAGNATTVGFGPRFLHSTGQLHKGGPNTGVFLQLVDTPLNDVSIPETDFTFRRVIASQALGDYLALKERGRRIMRIDLGPNRSKGLAAVIDAIG